MDARTLLEGAGRDLTRIHERIRALDLPLTRSQRDALEMVLRDIRVVAFNISGRSVEGMQREEDLRVAEEKESEGLSALFG